LEHHLLNEENVNEDELEAIDQAVEQELETAMQFAEESPFPEPEALFTDVYMEA